MSTTTVLTVLSDARALLAEPGVWTQTSFARDAQGQPCESSSPEACQFCALGAIERAEHTRYGFAMHWSASREALVAALPQGALDSVMVFNDNPTRTVDEVLALFDRAVTLLAAQEAA